MNIDKHERQLPGPEKLHVATAVVNGWKLPVLTPLVSSSGHYDARIETLPPDAMSLDLFPVTSTCIAEMILELLY
jgi:hypothetical protein